MADIFIDRSSSHGSIRPRLHLNVSWRRFLIPATIFMLALLPRLLNLEAFLTADEDDQIMFAHLFLKSVLQGDFSGALVLGYPGVPTLVLGALGVGLRYLFHYAGWLPLAWVQGDLETTLTQMTVTFGTFKYPMDFLLWVRLPMALVASISVLGIFLLVKRLVHEQLAFLAALIIAFDPFILAHSRVIHVDAPLSYFMFLSFLAFLLYLDKGTWRWLLISGLFGGLAALSKTPAGLLGPILVVSGLFYAMFPPPMLPRNVRRKRLVIALIGWGVIAVGAFVALWPSMWSRPWEIVWQIIENIQSVNRTAHPTTGIFWGETESDQNPFYYLVVLPYHLTPLTSIGVLAGLGMIGAGFLARWRLSTFQLEKHWAARKLPLALSLIAYVTIFIAPVSFISRRGDRYILPVYFATGLLSVLALWWLILLAKKHWLKRSQWTPFKIGGVIIALQACLVLLYHPYYLAYYNPLVGGAKAASLRINVGWGEGLNLAARYLNQRPDSKTAQVASWYSKQFASFFEGQTVDLSNQGSALTGDYIVFYINQVQRGFPSGEILEYFQQREPLKEIKLGGITYAWVYDGPVVSQHPPENYRFPVGILMGGGAHLVGVDIPHTEMAADEYDVQWRPDNPVFGDPMSGLPVTLYWQTMAQIHGEHNVYIRLVDEKGHIWGQVDRLILAGLWRPDRWYSGYFLRDEYKLPIDPATPPGKYHLEVGMYDFVTGQSYGVAKNIGEITLLPAKKVTSLYDLELENRVDQAIDENLSLLGNTFLDTQAPPGATLNGKIFWQIQRSTDKDYLLEFSFLSPENREKHIITKAPLSAYPTSEWRRSEVLGSGYRLNIPALAPPGEYLLSVNVIDMESDQILGSEVTLATVTVEEIERHYTLPKNVTPISAFVNDEIELVGYQLHDTEVAPEKTFGLTLYWRALKVPEANYTVFIHAMGPDQVMRGQWDSTPAGGASPTGGWVPGEIIEDHYEVPMNKDAPPWKYDIFVGMYDALTGQRQEMSSKKAPTSDNRVWLTRVQVVQEAEE